MMGRNSPTDEQPTQPETGSALDVAVREFSRQIFDLELEWDALAAALKTGDPIEIEVSANDLTCAWQGARRAHKTIEDRLADAREQERRAQSVLRAHRRALGDLAQRALTRIAGTPVHDRLRQVLAELGKLGSEGAASGDAPSHDDTAHHADASPPGNASPSPSAT